MSVSFAGLFVDMLPPPQLTNTPENKSALRTLMARMAGPSLMAKTCRLGGGAREQTSLLGLYELDYTISILNSN